MNNIGEYQDREKFVPMLINKINTGEEVTIHGEEGDIGSRYYLHARNKADAILFILMNTKATMYHDSIDEVIVPDRYNIVGDVELNNLELAQMVADILGKPLKYKLENFHATRPGHDRRYALDGTKLRDLGWKAPVSFVDSLKKTIAWTLERPEWLS
jgi:dTDP-glucose 4,6-dehydratase